MKPNCEGSTCPAPQRGPIEQAWGELSVCTEASPVTPTWIWNSANAPGWLIISPHPQLPTRDSYHWLTTITSVFSAPTGRNRQISAHYCLQTGELLFSSRQHHDVSLYIAAGFNRAGGGANRCATCAGALTWGSRMYFSNKWQKAFFPHFFLFLKCI